METDGMDFERWPTHMGHTITSSSYVTLLLNCNVREWELRIGRASYPPVQYRKTLRARQREKMTVIKRHIIEHGRTTDTFLYDFTRVARERFLWQSRC